jgi:hypothetical protein
MPAAGVGTAAPRLPRLSPIGLRGPASGCLGVVARSPVLQRAIPNDDLRAMRCSGAVRLCSLATGHATLTRRDRMNLKVVALLAPLLVLCACGGSAAKSIATSTAVTKAATTQPGQSVTASASAAAAGNPVNGADFCAFLTTMQPRMTADGSAVGALADLAIEFASWLDTHAAQKPRTAADLDEASQSSCPAIRTAVLNVLEKDSFASALG